MEALGTGWGRTSGMGTAFDMTCADSKIRVVNGSASGRDHFVTGILMSRSSRKPMDVRHLQCCQRASLMQFPVWGLSSVRLVRKAVPHPSLRSAAIERSVLGSQTDVRTSTTSCRSPAALSASSTSFRSPNGDSLSVSDVMTKVAIISVKTTTTINEALQTLVDNRISGAPVVDDDNFVIGMVSDYDLLSLEAVLGAERDLNSIFPVQGNTWKKIFDKTRGKTVGDVMTANPVVVQSTTNLEDAVRLLLEGKHKKLPVVDDKKKLVGILSRGNVVRMALRLRAAEPEMKNSE